MQEDEKTLVGGQTLNLTFSLKSQNGGIHPIIGETSIGRGADNQIVIDDKKVSRKHALIEIVDGKLIIQDLKSSNGTLVNEKKITTIHPIVNGDTLSFDSNIFTVEVSIKTDDMPKPVEDSNSSATIVMQTPEIEQAKVVPEIKEQKVAKPAVKNEAKTTEKIISKAGSNREMPASWIEENSVNDGTKMMDINSLNALRNKIKILTEDHQALPKEVLVTTLNCNVDGINQVVELPIDPSKQQASWEIGRSSQCDVVIDHPSVSSRHAQIIHTSGRWKIVNLVSTNGILVNGQKKLTAFLSDRDTIDLGSSHIIFNTPLNSLSARKQKTTNTGFSKILIGVVFLALLGAIAYLGYDYFK